jgi:hypothetical protein
MKIDYVRVITLLTKLAAAASSLASLQAFAESERHGAHIHGVAELTLALEDTKLEISFNSPAISVLGFEHKASNSTQLRAVDDARAKLRDAASFFAFAGTTCTLQSATVDMSSVLSPEHNSHDGVTSHTDIRAHYEYKCTDGEQLQSLRVGRAALPFDLQEINAIWVLENAQGATVLNAKKQLIQLN